MGTHPNGPSHLFGSPSTSILLLDSPAAHSQCPSRRNSQTLNICRSSSRSSPSRRRCCCKDTPTRLSPNVYGHRIQTRHRTITTSRDCAAIGKPLGAGDDALLLGDVDTAFTSFVGFHSLAEIQQALQGMLELRRTVGNEGHVRAFSEFMNLGCVLVRAPTLVKA
ncbi:hypothetical protein SCP_1004610 [Sparassis crispa]|uniref:Uncharacterized protein n=1 Tax=Sparassis crispa TaxID=139825 RepID=A0A401GYJ8_9APHY|nr:hypothetical protein SCP_1004610 [Sparassis crispa]GBE87214.1 hypothetical protein SCP_1004610 [Sparassis crispa]